MASTGAISLNVNRNILIQSPDIESTDLRLKVGDSKCYSKKRKSNNVPKIKTRISTGISTETLAADDENSFHDSTPLKKRKTFGHQLYGDSFLTWKKKE